MAQNDSIQALIQEIDEVLSKTSPRLPWVMSTDAMRQRQVLEQARSCLDKLQIPSQGLDQAIDPEIKLLSSGQPSAESAQQVLQAVLQEMTYLRVNMLQPMRSDVDLLRQQREALTQEIRQLEAQRQQYGLPQGNPQLLMEFLQSAMGQMQESLRGQVTQMVASLAVEGTIEPPLLNGSSENLAIASLTPAERLEQIQHVQTQSDQLLLKLDSTLQVIFDSLQNNILSYQESLEQGLSRMQSLGQQGEAMFSALVTRLAEQLGKEASVYLHSQAQAPSHSQVQAPSHSQVQAPSHSQVLEGDRAPSPKAPLDESADAEISRLLEELNSLSPSKPASSLPASLPDSLETRWQPQPFALEVGNLEALDRELQQLDLAVIDLAVPIDVDIDNFPDDDDLTLFQEDQEFPFSKFSLEDTTQIQNPELNQTIQDLDLGSASVSQDPSQSFSQSVTPSDSSFEDLESALDLLNQLSAEAKAELPEIGVYTAQSYGAEPYKSLPANALPVNALKSDATLEPGSAAEAILEEKSEAIAPLIPSLIDSPDNLYTDDFYQSLFGDVQDESSKAPEPSDPTNLTSDLDSNLADIQLADIQLTDLHPTNLPVLDPAPETPEPKDLLSFELDTENELAPSLDLNEWFSEDAPPQTLPQISRQIPRQPEDSTSYDLTEAPLNLADDASSFNVSSSREDIFGGAVDPAIAQPVQDAEADFLPDFSIVPLPQSVENFLLSEPLLQEPAALDPSEISAPPLEEDLFWELAKEIQTEPVAASPAVAAPTETISALTDLISAYAASQTEIPETDILGTIAAPLESDASEERDPDAFEPAHPGEDLLISALPQELTIASFEVGEDTLQRLTADLFTLELSSAETQSERGTAPENRDDNLSVDPLADLYLEIPPEAAIDNQTDQIANAITLEDLLFAGELDSLTPAIDSLQALNQTSDQTSDQTLGLPLDKTSADQTVPPQAASGESDNAFTLEGLDILFEGVPSTMPSSEALDLKTPNPEPPDFKPPSFEPPSFERQPKKKV